MKLFDWIAVGLGILILGLFLSAPTPPGTSPVGYLLVNGGGHCTTFFVGHQEFLTAGHCMDNKDGKYKIIMDNKTIIDAAEVKSGADYAILKTLQTVPAKPMPLSCNDPPVGDSVKMEGFPLWLPKLVHRGFVSGGRKDINDSAISFFDLSIAPGFSGAPISDSTGVVAIAVAHPIEPGNKNEPDKIYPAITIGTPMSFVCPLLEFDSG